ncbi:MAG: retroviral-like aspartic protease family protein [Defluviitaleaceae bacterium]|nr:retroviral-like aspartic protease family protein [Defluviitaleaceae bacterium]
MYIAKLNATVMYRTRFESKFYVGNTAEVFAVETILDSGCANTMLPLRFAKKSGGLALPLKKNINIAGNSGEAQGYIIPKIEIGGYVFTDVFVYAANYRNELSDKMLLGLNVINNLRYTIDRAAGNLEFTERLHDSLPNQAFPYRNYFDDVGNYVMLSEDMVNTKT